MNIISFFDGMSCGQIALNRLGIKYDNYFAYEIDSNAIIVTQNNFPLTQQMGSVVTANLDELPKVDLLIGGSPCQGFSIAGKKLNFCDERSKLFFEFVKAKDKLKPKYFLLENVKMVDEIADKIDELMGVKRIFINSVDFTGLIRKRYYWTNLPFTELPSSDLYIKDIIDTDIPFDKDLKYLLDKTQYKPITSRDGIITINPKDNKNKQTWQRGRVYDINGKCPTICATLFDLNITENHKTFRKLTVNECEKFQGVPKDYTSSATKYERGKMLGNGWNVDTIMHFFKHINAY